MKELLVFGSSQCGPCASLLQTLDDMGLDYEYLDIMQHPKEANRFHIKSVPAMVLLVDGTPVRAIFGNVPAKRIKEFIK